MTPTTLRITWLPGDDRLRGRCHCGAQTEADEPVALWEWLLAHPEHPAGGPVSLDPPASRPPAHLVRSL